MNKKFLIAAGILFLLGIGLGLTGMAMGARAQVREMIYASMPNGEVTITGGDSVYIHEADLYIEENGVHIGGNDGIHITSNGVSIGGRDGVYVGPGGIKIGGKWLIRGKTQTLYGYDWDWDSRIRIVEVPSGADR